MKNEFLPKNLRDWMSEMEECKMPVTLSVYKWLCATNSLNDEYEFVHKRKWSKKGGFAMPAFSLYDIYKKLKDMIEHPQWRVVCNGK